jgi:hypothetical protein
MSHMTSLSIKDKHIPQYLVLRNWLKQKNMGLGDYLMDKFNAQFSNHNDLTNIK